MGALDGILIPSLRLEEILADGSTLTNPAADSRRLFLGEDGSLYLKDSAGAVTVVGGGGAGFTFSGARAVRAGSNQTITDSTDTALSFDSDSDSAYLCFDEGGIWAIGNPTRFTADQTGYWDCDAVIVWDSNTVANRQIYVLINASASPPGKSIPAVAYLNEDFHTVVFLTAGDYVEFWVYQGSGGSRTVTLGAAAGITYRGAA